MLNGENEEYSRWVDVSDEHDAVNVLHLSLIKMLATRRDRAHSELILGEIEHLQCCIWCDAHP